MPASNTILYVDDDQDDQDVFLEVLRQVYPSVNCVTAKNGIEAFAKLKAMSDPPICIYRDVNMPIMEGPEVLRIIKLDTVLSKIPVFILTTGRTMNSEKHMRDLGATDFFLKPNTYEELSKLVSASLKTYLNL